MLFLVRLTLNGRPIYKKTNVIKWMLLFWRGSVEVIQVKQSNNWFGLANFPQMISSVLIPPVLTASEISVGSSNFLVFFFSLAVAELRFLFSRLMVCEDSFLSQLCTPLLSTEHHFVKPVLFLKISLYMQIWVLQTAGWIYLTAGVSAAVFVMLHQISAKKSCFVEQRALSQCQSAHINITYVFHLLLLQWLNLSGQ